MFAVIKTGGKQYKVAKDDVVVIEKLAADPGETVQFNDVLMLGGDAVTLGDPLIADAGVQAEVLEQGRAKKVLNFKKRRRKHGSQRLKGHRQYITTVRVTDVLATGAGASGVRAALGAASVGAISAAAPPEVKPKAKPKAKAEAKPEATAKAKDKQPAAETAPTDDAPGIAATKPTNLLDGPQGAADDLTAISGVGPKLLEKLNANGVYHFWQIVEWGPGEVAFMDDQLSFKGRIGRDEWIDQAGKLATDNTKSS